MEKHKFWRKENPQNSLICNQDRKFVTNLWESCVLFLSPEMALASIKGNLLYKSSYGQNNILGKFVTNGIGKTPFLLTADECF